MLYLYYTNLCKSIEKNKFITEVMEKCRVTYPTVRSWVSPTTSKIYRYPKPIYRGIIAEIAGIEENQLFEE